ncbi:hypothetical protein GCM10010520_67010 [Rhizobium viscosum]|uniref:Uncharacterized protein n=1 Tax=Rhizobium viscosum TaxID=1673 RepID=A0ABR9IU30_RHIVS|nr:hypothetical protein [Rhizobium viscosum]MBE1506633.1 hypothetical protein [Rhizobium viscosum]
MIERHISGRDQPMTSEDLAICQRVLDAVKAEFKLDGDEEETARIAAVTIELYRQGVHNFDQLKALVSAAGDRT